jgi:hypothetical protein
VTPEEREQILETDRRLTEVAYRHAETAIERSTNHFSRLDAKATTLASVVGVITTVLLSVALGVFPQEKSSSWFFFVSAALTVLSLTFLFVSMGHCIAALRVRNIQDLPLIREVLEALPAFDRRPGDEVRLKKRLLLPLSRVDYAFAFEARQKANHLQGATKWLIGAFVALALNGVCFTIHISNQLYERYQSRTIRSSPTSR